MIVTARYCHVCQMLTAGLRAADLKEIEAGSPYRPDVALRRSYLFSTKRWACVNDAGRAVAMWGVAPHLQDETVGVPWLLATEDFRYHRKELLRNTRAHVAEMAKGFRMLTNLVSVEHHESIRWLRWAGFKFSSTIILLGERRSPFRQFTLETTHV